MDNKEKAPATVEQEGKSVEDKAREYDTSAKWHDEDMIDAMEFIGTCNPQNNSELLKWSKYFLVKQANKKGYLSRANEQGKEAVRFLKYAYKEGWEHLDGERLFRINVGDEKVEYKTHEQLFEIYTSQINHDKIKL